MAFGGSAEAAFIPFHALSSPNSVKIKLMKDDGGISHFFLTLCGLLVFEMVIWIKRITSAVGFATQEEPSQGTTDKLLQNAADTFAWHMAACLPWQGCFVL